MTLLSVVLPVYKVQGYLRECLDSILRQAPADLELIAVDDRSPDGSGGILAEYAARDPRVRVLALAENVGLGRARNAGLDAATGEYVWFIDSDDWLTDGAMPAVLERLGRAKPQVLLVDHRRVFWNGSVLSSYQPAEFRDLPEPCDARQIRWVLSTPHVAWNKIFQRRFLVDLGLRFDTGWYEDVSFTFPALVAAERISVLDRVCVNYRQRRVGAITRTVGDRHFEIFPHWERAFALLDGLGPAADELRPDVFARMIWHYLVVIGNADRVPMRSRKAFFQRAAADYARFLPPGGYPVPGGMNGVKHRLLARGGWHTYALLWAGVRAAKRLARLPGALTSVARNAVRAMGILRHGLPYVAARVYYALAVRLLPIDENLAVYAAYWYRGYSCNPAAIYERARELAPQVRGVWLVNADRVDRLPPGVEYAVPGTLAYYRALASAKYLINNVNFPDNVVRRRGSVHLQTHHGAPVKVMGIEQAEYPGGALIDYAAMLRRCDRWHLSISSNALSTEVWDRAYPCHFEHLEYGYPRNDRLVRADADEVARCRAALGAGPDDVVALYMPTHRSNDPEYRPPFDVERVAGALGPRGMLLVRSHYFNEEHTVEADRERVRDVSGHPTVEDLYLAADVLITDYSSAMFDYAVLDRPIVIYAPDWAEYQAGRGVVLDLMECPPGAVAQTFDGLLELLRAGAQTGGYADQRAALVRAAFRERFCSWDDGNAAERVVRRVMLGEPVPGQRQADTVSALTAPPGPVN